MVALVSCLMSSSVSGVPSQWAKKKTTFFDFNFELLIRVNGMGVGGAEIFGALQEVTLDILKQRSNCRYKVGKIKGFLGFGISASDFNFSVFEIAWAHCQAHRNTFGLVFCEFPARTAVVVVVVFETDALCLEFKC